MTHPFNDFLEVLPFLKRELKELECSEVSVSVESILEVMSNNGADEADAAVREYTKTLIWPRVSHPVRLELCLRLRVAIWYIETLASTGCEGETLEEFLPSILIEYWRDVGRHDWVYNHFVNQDVSI